MTTLVREEQRHRVLKARVAVALYSENGKVPKEEEVEGMYRIVDALYKIVLGAHYTRKQQIKDGQLVLL
jgi:hypothetical protein